MKIFFQNKTSRYGNIGCPLTGARVMTVTIVLLAALGLSACYLMRDPFNLIIELKENQPQLPAAERPDLRKGDFFTYDDDITHTVATVGKDRISWRIGNTFMYETSRDFVHPWLKWSTGTVAWKTVVRNDIGDLWPLFVGKIQRYTLENELVSTKKDHEYEEEYDCWVPGTETITVPAGTFDTFVVACYRLIVAKVYKTDIWYYAPKVGHVVKSIEEPTPYSERIIVELRSYGISLESLASEDRTEIEAAFQNTLQMMPSGQSSIWRRKNSEDLIETTPTGTYLQDDGRYCRDYIQRIALEGRERSIAGRACRNSGGRWESART